MNVLVIGSGGREHAIAWRLSNEGAEVFITPGNDGIISDGIHKANVAWDNFEELVKFVSIEGIELVVIGPEKPLCLGLADYLSSKKIPVIGPNSNAAKLEASKHFAKIIMEKAKIPTAAYTSFSDFSAAKTFLESSGKVVIKADGLAGGKGVVLPNSIEEGIAYLDFFMNRAAFGASSKKVLIEERLEGPEISFMCLTDGKHIVSFPTSRDHKRLLDGDRGPNTGGMGAISPSPDEEEGFKDWVIKSVVRPLLHTLASEGISYSGFLYVGLMMTVNGPRVLEFNVRLGDPETQALMLALKEPLLPFLIKSANGELDSDHVLKSEPASCVVLASENYAEGVVEKGRKISGIESLSAKVFFAGVSGKRGAWETEGGRVLSVCKAGENATAVCLEQAELIRWDGVQFRKDFERV